jgi:hypothetical protein
LTSIVIALCVAYFGYPPIGFGGIFFISSVGVVLAIGAGLISLALAALLLIRRRKPKPTNPIIISALSISLALLFVWSM